MVNCEWRMTNSGPVGWGRSPRRLCAAVIVLLAITLSANAQRPDETKRERGRGMLAKMPVLKPGEMFLLPPTSRIRRAAKKDRGLWWSNAGAALTNSIAWFCENCDNNLYEASPRWSEGPNDQGNSSVDEGNRKLRNDPDLSTCKRCGETLQIGN